MAKTITFTIKDGEVQIDMKGYNGVGYKEDMDKFKSLGAQTYEKLKPEIHDTCNTGNLVNA